MRIGRILATALATLGLAGSLATAGSLAVVTMQKGGAVQVEILAYANDLLVVRELASRAIQRISAEDVVRIDFREAPEGGPRTAEWRPVTLGEVETLALMHRFPMLLMRLRASVARQHSPAVEKIKQALAEQMAGERIDTESRRDLRLAHTLSLLALAEREQASQTLRTLRADYPDDPVVRRFEEELRRLEGLRRQGAPRRGPRSESPDPVERNRNVPR